MDYIGSDELGFGAGRPVDPETLRAEALARRRPLNQITTEELARGFGFGGRSNIPGYSRAEIQAELDRRQSSQFPPGAPAQMYRGEAIESTPQNLGTVPAAPPPPPPRPREPARPGAPAVGLPPRVEMGEGNISELVSQRLGQIKPPEETKSFLDNPYLALVQAGLSMMADSRGKSPLEAIAGGGRAGLQVAMDQRAAARAQEQRRYVQEMERLKAENEMRRALGEEAYRRASLGVTQRGQDVQAEAQRMQSAIQERVANRQLRIEQMRHSQAQAQALRDQVRDILKLADIEKDLALAAERSGDRAAAAEHRSRVNGHIQEAERLRGFTRPSPESAVPATNQGTPAR